MTRPSRRKAREAALKVLYQVDARGREALAALTAMTPRGADVAYAERLARECAAGRRALDAEIRRAAVNWRVSRIATVERNILRIGVYELLHAPEVPAAVVIDEAVRLARRFGDAQSYAFVNGVLDAVARRVRRRARDEEE